MGINIEFDSHQAKQQFSAAASGGFGDIFSASASISKIASQYNLQGTVSMQAYQIGGNPAELSNILSKSSNGDYYALSCSINNINDCQMAASGMLDYAKYNFTTQISFDKNQGLTPLGLGYVEYLPIDYLGLHAQSLVNQTVINDRMELAESLLENQYYVQKFHELVETYPVEWDTTSNIYQTSQNLYQQAQNNVNSIMSPDNPDQGALGCFDMPDQCDSITQNIQASLVPITQSDLEYLNGFEGAQYYYQIGSVGAYLFRSSDLEWTPYPVQLESDDRILVSPYQFNIDLQSLNYTADFTTYGHALNHGYYSGISDDAGLSYIGKGGDQNPPVWVIVYNASISPFYFTAYNSSNSDTTLLGDEPEGIADFA